MRDQENSRLIKGLLRNPEGHAALECLLRRHHFDRSSDRTGWNRGCNVTARRFERSLVPLKVTLVAPARLFPRIVTFVPALPEVGFVSPNGHGPLPSTGSVPSGRGLFADYADRRG
jgi:hypothetical protein